MTGLVIDQIGFEVLVGDRRIGSRRSIGPADVALLTELAQRYATAVQTPQTPAGADAFVQLGRELYEWLDSAGAQLSSLLDQAPRPLVFEVRGPRSPSMAGWALLRAPFELLARRGGGLLAEEALTRFCVARRLGVPEAGPELDGFRLGLAFMASAPGDAPELDFEGEEAAILRAVGETRIDLVVDETGDPDQLTHRLADLGGMPVVHLSCHGLIDRRPGPDAPGVPALWMETELGAARPTTAGELAGLLPDKARLLFVSACLTAANPDAQGLFAHSLATALVEAGIPAVIGWDGSVNDYAATAFAGQLYRSLADRVGLTVAVGDARRALLNSDQWVLRRDWHLARLWLGPAGGGPLVAGTRKRSLVRATRGTKMFLDRKHQVPVASADMFVGRRLLLQLALRTLRSGEAAGVLLHGQGRLGKSSLAARIADRCPDYVLAVVFGDYSAMAILDAVATAVRRNAAATTLIKAMRAEVRDHPEAIEAVLVALLTGPCAQAGENGAEPLLLIIDDLEQILVADPVGPHQVGPAHAGVLAGVLRAFDPAETDSRLLLTSRFTFTLGGLESRLVAVQLPPMSPVGQAKLLRRQQALAPAGRVAERAELAGRALTVSRGNPGLQDLIVLRLVYGDQVDLARAEAAVAGMEAYLGQGDLPADAAEVRVFLENLAIDTLLDEAGAAQVALLRALTLFDVPVPEPVVAVLAAKTGGSADRLIGLGLAEGYQDLYSSEHAALRVDPLAAGRLETLTPAKRTALASATIQPLFTAWGGPDPGERRNSVLDVQLARLALLSDTPEVVAACASSAVFYLLNGPAARASELGQAAISLLDRHQQVVPLTLMRWTADATVTSGDSQLGAVLLDRAVRLAQPGDADLDGALDHARAIAERGNYLLTRGDLEQAELLFRQAHQVFTGGQSDGEAAAVMASIADVAIIRGEYDEALRICRDVALPVFERLDNSLQIALNWSRIAEIAIRRGEHEEALRLFREVVLPIFERLGHPRGVAMTRGRIAETAFVRGEQEEALRLLREFVLPAFERLGDVRATAVTWVKIADIAYQRAEYEEALRLFSEVALPAFERLGDARAVAVTWVKIAAVAIERGEHDEAVRLLRDVALPAFERLGDAREVAVTWSKVADIAYERDEHAEAKRIRRDLVLPALRQLRDLDGIASVTWGLAQIELAQENCESAVSLMGEALKMFVRLKQPNGIAIVGWRLGQLLLASGQDEAVAVLELALAAAEQLGNADLAQQIRALLAEHLGSGEPSAGNPGH